MPCGLVLFNSNSNFDFACNQPVSRKKVLFKDVCANCFWASLLRTQIHMPCHACIERTCLVLKWTMLAGQCWWPLLYIALLGLTILDVQWTLLFFSETDFVYNYMYLHIVQNWTKNQSGKVRKIHDFCQWDNKFCHHVAARHMKLWSLNANFMLHAKSFCYCSVLFFRCCCFCCSLRNQLTKFA